MGMSDLERWQRVNFLTFSEDAELSNLEVARALRGTDELDEQISAYYELMEIRRLRILDRLRLETS